MEEGFEVRAETLDEYGLHLEVTPKQHELQLWILAKNLGLSDAEACAAPKSAPSSSSSRSTEYSSRSAVTIGSGHGRPPRSKCFATLRSKAVLL